MSYFQAEMTPRFQQRLTEREAQLLAVLADEAAQEQAAAATHERGQEVTDFKELAEEETMTAVHEMQHAHAVRELGAVREARRRLAAGQYGVCQACGEAIELRRLEAMPTALRCMRCQSKAEKS